ncbi:MAG: hypothetical protein EYC62_07310 [Alphaproteobacteria bacterium]|nr:MAG: hypothetical protein EYC62_07310 [Alphaproteobacteria bacterium]
MNLDLQAIEEGRRTAALQQVQKFWEAVQQDATLSRLQELGNLLSYTDDGFSGLKPVDPVQIGSEKYGKLKAACIEYAKDRFALLLLFKDNTQGFSDTDAHKTVKKIKWLLYTAQTDYSVLVQGQSDENVKAVIQDVLRMTLVYTIRGCLSGCYAETNFAKPSCFTTILPKSLDQLQIEHADTDYRLIDPLEKIPSDQMKTIVHNIKDRKPDIATLDFIYSRFYDPKKPDHKNLARFMLQQADTLGFSLAHLPSMGGLMEPDKAYGLIGDVMELRFDALAQKANAAIGTYAGGRASK